MQIHDLVLRRVDGSELRQRYIAAFDDAPRIGSMIEVSLPGLLRIPAMVTGVETLTPPTHGGRTSWRTELRVYAKEIMCVPVAANEA